MSKRKIRALIVEDESYLRELIATIVESIGAEVREAEDGDQALQYFTEFYPDIVLLDINMPKHDGIYVLKKIMQQRPKTLMIMLSALDTMETVQECIDHGAYNYILKNTPADELLNAIRLTWKEYRAEMKTSLKEQE